MFFRHHSDKLIYPLLLLVLFVILSYRSTYHLSPEMPKDFFPQPVAQKHSFEEKIAWAYWESAQMDIQWKYPHGHLLPVDAPPEFRIHAQALGPPDPVTRAYYWRRLQEVWSSPEAWEKKYEWSWAWAGDPLSSAGEWLRDHADRWFRLPN